MATLGERREVDFADTVLDAYLLLAGDVHYVEGEQLAGYPREGDVEMDFHFLAYGTIMSIGLRFSVY